MYVARLQADPVRRGQVPDGVGRVRVLDQLGPRRRTAREVEQQGLVGPGVHLGGEALEQREGVVVAQPALDRVADGDAGPAARHSVELGGVARRGDDVPDVTALDAVGQVAGAEQRGGRDHHDPELDRPQHDLPQRRDVAQHQQEPVAAVDTLLLEPHSHLGGPRRQLGIAAPVLGAVVVDDPERRSVGLLSGQYVEPVEAEVEGLELGPPELGAGLVVVVAVGQQEVAGRSEGLGCTHARDPRTSRAGGSTVLPTRGPAHSGQPDRRW
jgi:hypothetical protein